MLRTSIAFVGTLIALFLMVGLQTRSTAQTASAFSSSWAEDSTATNFLRVYTDVSYDDSGNLGGRFGFSGLGFTCQGAASTLDTSEDDSGNYTAVITGYVRYYTVVNGVKSKKGILGTGTLTLSLLADGVTYSEGLEVDDIDGNVLFTTGTNDDGTPTLWSLSRGSISISL